ncbi:NAD(P)/FAD-dependent oxidoreductase [Conexibacter sp. SYSU D00693]|uniref:flavin-containing monooxygenase n=1 Tax=Conexibacter sp. SYSU D00693 TaxID=2812560 RepID=UPI00196B0E25|nr:NAD(P)/FAD-dependent oxidoreductase [Conexibacter sp. SYSU D00693]
MPPDHEVLIIGAGLAGIAAGVRLRRAGIDDFVLLEAAGEVGGTWRTNTYPGIAVDVPSFQYQLSTDLHPGWSRVFAPGHEIKAYAEEVVDRHGLRERIRFGTRAAHARFDEDDDLWRVELDGGEQLSARFLIPATGGLTTPRMPDIAGIEGFRGTAIHTARWDHDHDLTGERVAVIGTGATAVQLVPAIADRVRVLHVFQRTPIWVLPKADRDLSRLRRVFERVPGATRGARALFTALAEVPFVLTTAYHRQVPQLAQAMEALGRKHLRAQVPDDPELRARLTPRYGFGCKRPSVSNHYLRTFTKPQVELVTDPIERITPTGVRTATGRDVEVDTIVFATGYFTTEPGNLPTVPVAGIGGQDLNAFWQEHRFQAYEGVAVPGFPNLFLSFGPYLVPGMSIITGIENAVTHAIRVIREARRRGATRAEVRRAPHDAYFALMQRRQRSTVFFNNGCAGANSYYFDRHGDAPLLRPGGSLEAWWRAHRFPLGDYAYTTAASRPAAPGAAPRRAAARPASPAAAR